MKIYVGPLSSLCTRIFLPLWLKLMTKKRFSESKWALNLAFGGPKTRKPWRERSKFCSVIHLWIRTSNWSSSSHIGVFENVKRASFQLLQKCQLPSFGRLFQALMVKLMRLISCTLSTTVITYNIKIYYYPNKCLSCVISTKLKYSVLVLHVVI